MQFDHKERLAALLQSIGNDASDHSIPHNDRTMRRRCDLGRPNYRRQLRSDRGNIMAKPLFKARS